MSRVVRDTIPAGRYSTQQHHKQCHMSLMKMSSIESVDEGHYDEDFEEVSEDYEESPTTTQPSLKSSSSTTATTNKIEDYHEKELFAKGKSPSQVLSSPSTSTPRDSVDVERRSVSSQGLRRRQRTPSWITDKLWRLGEKIGSGSFGDVFQAMTDKGKFCAVKRMSVADKSAELDNLLSEIQLMRGLAHENIVEYLGAFVDDDSCCLYIFQEWVPGGSVAGLLKKFGSFPLNVVRNYTRQILRGLVYLHANGIIHRDIKGGNVLVDDSGTVKLADFGASTTLSAFDKTQDTTTIKGTPYFMAPEVLSSSRYGRKGDIWAVGCTMVQMLTGEPPWKDRNLKGLIQLHLLLAAWSEPYPQITGITLTPEAKDCLTLCFQKLPNDRPTADELLHCAFLQESNSPSDPSQSSNRDRDRDRRDHDNDHDSDGLEDSGVLFGLKQDLVRAVTRSMNLNPNPSTTNLNPGPNANPNASLHVLPEKAFTSSPQRPSPSPYPSQSNSLVSPSNRSLGIGSGLGLQSVSNNPFGRASKPSTPKALDTLSPGPSPGPSIKDSLNVIKRKVHEKNTANNHINNTANNTSSDLIMGVQRMHQANQSSARDSESITPLPLDDVKEGRSGRSNKYDTAYFEEKELFVSPRTVSIPNLLREESCESVEEQLLTLQEDQEDEEEEEEGLFYMHTNPNPNSAAYNPSYNPNPNSRVQRRYHPRLDADVPAMLKSASASDGLLTSQRRNHADVVPRLMGLDQRKVTNTSQSVSARSVRPIDVSLGLRDSVRRPFSSKAALGNPSPNPNPNPGPTASAKGRYNL